MHRVHTESLSRSAKRALWDEIIKDYLDSNLSIKKYSQAHGLKQDLLNYYVRQYKKQHAQPSTFIPVTLDESTKDEISLEYRGMTVRLSANKSSQLIRQLLADLRAVC